VARRGKFARLVEDFVATVDELGGRADPTVVAAELEAVSTRSPRSDTSPPG